ncbi:MAG: c-type cytochrome [Actinomycetota bacterium]
MKRLPAILSLSLILLLLAAGQLLAQAPQPAPKTAEQQFKNIKVLKGIPADELIPSMQFIANSLGVECEFCHERGAFEKDDKKPKQTARKMIEMELAINHDNFKGQTAVTCFSCHRGAENPVGIPIISDEAPKPREAGAAEKTAPALPTPADILGKYLQAVGGAAAVEKVTSLHESGTVSFAGRQFPVEVLTKAPNKRISIVHLPNGDNITAFDGQKGWLASPGPRPPREMNPQENEASSFDATLHLPAELSKMFAQFHVRPAESIDGHEVVQVIGTNQGKPPLRLFFDKQSGLLLRTIRYAQTPLGRNPTQIDYADYKEEGGVWIPLQWTIARPLGRFTIHIDKVEQNVPIADSKFEKPAAKPGQQKSRGE